MHAHRTKKTCQLCGRSFFGGSDCYYCPECAKIKKSDTVIRIRVCQDCNTEFFGGPRAMRCPDCAYMAKVHYKRKPTARPIGSIDKCIICGKEYTVISGRQKYCSDACQREGVLEWQRRHKKGYHKLSGQDARKQERRKHTQKICVYCLRPFTSDTSTNLCSDYCRAEQKKLLQCVADIKRGYKRNLQKYEDERTRYRKECQNDR